MLSKTEPLQKPDQTKKDILRFESNPSLVSADKIKLVEVLNAALSENPHASEENGAAVEILEFSLEEALESALNEADLVAPLTEQIRMPSQDFLKSTTIEHLRAHGLSEYVDEYAAFFLSFLERTAPTMNILLATTKERLPAESKKDHLVREAFISQLAAHEFVQSQFGQVSNKHDSIFQETPASDEISQILLSSIMNNAEVLEGLTNDSKNRASHLNDVENIYRCISILPCKITQADFYGGHDKIVCLVGLSGYVESWEEDKPFCILHQKAKNFINDLVIKHPEFGDIEFRYIEHASRSYDLLLHEINRSTSASGELLDERSHVLPTLPNRECSEKKVFLELTKQFLLANQNGAKIQILGQNCFFMPKLNDLTSPETTPPEKMQFQSLTKSDKVKVLDIEARKETYNTEYEELNAQLTDEKLTKSGRKKLDKRIQACEKKISTSNQQLSEIQKKLIKVLYVRSLYNTENPASGEYYYRFTSAPACGHCQRQKFSYLSVLLHGSRLDLTDLFPLAEASTNGLFNRTSIPLHQYFGSCRTQANELPKPESISLGLIDQTSEELSPTRATVVRDRKRRPLLVKSLF